jgi:hypothetical protein
MEYVPGKRQQSYEPAPGETFADELCASNAIPLPEEG